MTGRVIVVGSINTDLVVRVPRFPVPGETIAGHSFDIYGGGKGANQAIAAARLGAAVRMVGAVGDDRYSQERLVDLQREAIDTTGVKVCPGDGGIALIHVNDQGENEIVIISGANAAVSPWQVQISLSNLSAGDVVCCQLEIPVEATLSAFKAAKAKSALCVLNAAPYSVDIDRLLFLVDVLIVNEIEATQIAGFNPIDQQWDAAIMRRLQSMGPETVIMTRGQQGAYLVAGSRERSLPAPVVTTVDSTGAGDAFAGAVAVALAAGQPVDDAVRLAVYAGALAVQRKGAQPSLPTLEDMATAGFVSSAG